MHIELVTIKSHIKSYCFTFSRNEITSKSKQSNKKTIDTHVYAY
jgi:hypothetical protein